MGRLLDGTQFDSSLDRGTPFKYKLGEGRVSLQSGLQFACLIEIFLFFKMNESIC